MKLTRSQRSQLAWTMFVVVGALLSWMIWSQRLFAYTATPTGSTIVREFGLVRYLTIKTEQSGPIGVPLPPAQQTAVSSDWQWKPTAVAINVGITLAVLGVLGFSCIRMVRRERLIGQCDECGYDLTGLHSEVCPECGRPVDGSQAGGR